MNPLKKYLERRKKRKKSAKLDNLIEDLAKELIDNGSGELRSESELEKEKEIYKESLAQIYDGLSVEELKRAHRLLVKSEKYFEKHDDDMWWDALTELKRLLNYPKWFYGQGEDDFSDIPNCGEMDIEYIENLLKNRR